MWRWTFVLYVSMTASAHVSRVVQLPQGPVRGYRDPGGDIFTFYGIPYAAAPTGVNKFKAPLPPPTWQETLEAIDKGIICPQADFAPIVPKEKLMQEDCLIANIFQPDTKKNNLPVFIIIHGGGFQIGYGNWLTDIFFTNPILLSTKTHLENVHDQIYLYEYSFTDKNVALIPHTNVRGAEHCAQSMAVFDGTGLNQPDELNITLEYKEIKRTMRELWSNFITTGKPVLEGSPFPSWPAVRANFTPYMSLGQTLELKSALLERRVRFWSDIYDKYYHTPVPPPKLRISYDEL
ncbi:uncharacterized protein LOC115445561 isoform X2 [Manduca sexta]|uniref:uncharacterized protein LOC115445561 isoform X2 n=1 Tax=Manduca sexta TaxID=7130 RepID=UPI00188EF751|nr:uncharacterized protein LOC115445561 isoform X2 [Manduca sexta]